MCIGSQGDPFITETSITRARGGGYSGHTGLIYRGVREGGDGKGNILVYGAARFDVPPPARDGSYGDASSIGRLVHRTPRP